VLEPAHSHRTLTIAESRRPRTTANEGTALGWGGRMGDLFVGGSGTATFTCLNACTAHRRVFAGRRSA
jgi:hypothetical protein